VGIPFSFDIALLLKVTIYLFDVWQTMGSPLFINLIQKKDKIRFITALPVINGLVYFININRY